MQKDYIKDCCLLLIINFKLCIRNSMILSVLFLCAVPYIRGISNLDFQHSAECLEKTVSFIGMILLVPICSPEDELSIRTSILVKQKQYWRLVLIRMMTVLVILILEISLFQLIMQECQSTFPFMNCWFETFVTSFFLGMCGAGVACILRQVVLGYMVAIGIYVLNILKVIPIKSGWYLFSMTDVGVGHKGFLLGMCFVLIFIIIWFTQNKRETS